MSQEGTVTISIKDYEDLKKHEKNCLEKTPLLYRLIGETVFIQLQEPNVIIERLTKELNAAQGAERLLSDELTKLKSEKKNRRRFLWW